MESGFMRDLIRLLTQATTAKVFLVTEKVVHLIAENLDLKMTVPITFSKCIFFFDPSLENCYS
jgi:hypothetical protein